MRRAHAVTMLKTTAILATVALATFGCSDDSGEATAKAAENISRPLTLDDLETRAETPLPVGVYSAIPLNYPGLNSATGDLIKQANCGTPLIVANDDVLAQGMISEGKVMLREVALCENNGGTLSCAKAGKTSGTDYRIGDAKPEPRYLIRWRKAGDGPVLCRSNQPADVAACVALYACPAEVQALPLGNREGTLGAFIDNPPTLKN